MNNKHLVSSYGQLNNGFLSLPGGSENVHELGHQPKDRWMGKKMMLYKYKGNATVLTRAILS